MAQTHGKRILAVTSQTLFLTLLLAGCSSAPVKVVVRDGLSPDHPPPPNLASIPDATPRHEPPSRYGNPETYEVFGRQYRTLSNSQGFRERGIASWYGSKFHGNPTSSREPYDMYAMTAAHKSLPLPSYVRVKNLENGHSVVVRVNDRGPFHDNRIIDLSYAAAWKLGIANRGTGLVEIEAIDPNAREPIAPQPAPKSGQGLPRIFLQVGAFSQEDNALRLKQQLESEIKSRIAGDLEAVVLTPVEANETPRVYRVQVGPIASVQLCDHLTDRLTELGIPDPHVVIR